jgi:hypothetical protein
MRQIAFDSLHDPKSTQFDFFSNAPVFNATLQLTTVGAWMMSKLMLCCDINEFKIPTIKELSDSSHLFSYFQYQCKSWMGSDQPRKM